MDVAVAGMSFAILREGVRGRGRRGREGTGAHILKAFHETVVDDTEGVGDGAVSGGIVSEVEGGGVDEIEGDGMSGAEVDVDGCCSEEGGVARGALDEFCDGGELVFVVGGGDVGGVEEEAKKRRFTCVV